MTNQTEKYENYPAWIVLVYNLIAFSIYAAGLYLSYLIWPWLALAFLAYAIYLEVAIYREGCRYCYYYGKICVAGRGKIAKFFMKKGDPRKFTEKTVEFKDFIPTFLFSIMIIAAGIYLLIFRGFDWIILGITLWPVIIFFGNQITYGQLACPHCKQGEVGCPACEYFMKAQEKK